MSINYVGTLQERCVRDKIPLPEYILNDKTGPQHSLTFTMQVTILDHVAIGGGKKTKQEAKNDAAREMLNILDGSQSSSGTPFHNKAILKWGLLKFVQFYRL